MAKQGRRLARSQTIFTPTTRVGENSLIRPVTKSMLRALRCRGFMNIPSLQSRLNTSKGSHHNHGSRNECSTFIFGVWEVDGMGRIRQTIKVDGQECWTLFDTGARNTYVTPSVARVLQTSTMAHAFKTALGGGVKETNTSAILEAEIQGHPISTHALVIDEIAKDEDGRPI